MKPTKRDCIAAVCGLLVGVGATTYFSSRTNSEPINYTTPQAAGMKNIKIPEGVSNPISVLGTWNGIEGILVDMRTGMPDARLKLNAQRQPIGFDRVNDEMTYNKRTHQIGLGYTELLVPISPKK